MTDRTPVEALRSALAEFDNVRWDDVWANLQVAGAEELAEWTRKYVGYVRADIEEALAAARGEPHAHNFQRGYGVKPYCHDCGVEEEDAARGEPGLDVERLARALGGGPLVSETYRQMAGRVAAEYNRLGSDV